MRVLARLIGSLVAFALGGASVCAYGGYTGGEVRVVVYTAMEGDMSDAEGPGAVVAAELAAADARGRVGSVPVKVAGKDHGGDAVRARRGVDQLLADGADLVVGLAGRDVAEAVQTAVAGKAVTVATGAVTDRLTGAGCTPTAFHWVPDLYVLTQVTRAELRNQRGSRTIFIFGAGRREAIRNTYEHGMMQSGQDVTGQVFVTDIRALGLYAGSGMRLISPFYWKSTPRTRQWAKRFYARHGAMPTYDQAAVYSAVKHYLEAAAAVGSDRPAEVATAMRRAPVDDMYAPDGTLRADGQLVQDLQLMEVKRPGESEGAWDYFRRVRTLDGKAVYQPLAESSCAGAD
ncbi:ABC transporter substrate-binding protein [Arhodomonas sp. AD133]|uniref:ABC transporter substrate-binding protein n=1 Tax=Arhodomonas sp. AD133 TaxID=3415009 RepID=UPI003EBB60D2